MASCDEPGASAETYSRSHEDVRDTVELGSPLGEGRGPRQAPDLGTRFPSFPCDTLVDGTPSGEVQLRIPRRYEHVGEPAPILSPVLDFNPAGQNKEADSLRRQVASLQASLNAINARLENRPMQSSSGRDFEQHALNARERSSSLPCVDPHRPITSDPQSRNADPSSAPANRERSLSPSLYFADSGVQRSANYHTLASDLRHKSDFIKVAIYDGKSSWKDYLVQFELAAHANRWDKDTKAIKLACSLRGSAQALLSDMGPDVRYNYDQLVSTLTNRFEPENQCEIYKAQVKQRIRRKDEPLPELAQDIKKLMRMAYPSAVLDLRDTLAKDCFIEALNDAEMELFVCQKEPETMEDAVRIALKYEAFSQGRRKRLMSTKTGVRMQHEEACENLPYSDDLRQIQADLKEIKLSNKAHTNTNQGNRYQRKCWSCGETTHLQRSCPNTNQYDTNYRSDQGQRNRDGRFKTISNNQSTESTVTRSSRFSTGPSRNSNQGNRQ